MLTLKDIVMDRERMAEFSHAVAGVLYYRVDVGDEAYMFPLDMNNSDDVGTSTFNAREKAITMMRYIRKAMDNNSLIRIK